MRMRCATCCLLLIAALLLAACQRAAHRPAQRITAVNSPVLNRVVTDAIEQTERTVQYDPSYVKLDYPGGDLPLERGVCADVIVRAFRKGGVDLQKNIHEDMQADFNAYPHRWGLAKPDSNIDHRRVLNLMAYFERQGKALSLPSDPKDYAPGDVVAWDIGDDHPHIGIVSNVLAEMPGRYYVVHNIGAGAKMEDVLFAWRIIGHYRYFK